jgi:diguanylate cyclase (GGDEF)-like protein/PAS domain S-box-containing protein
MIIEPWRQRVFKAYQLGTTPPELQACVTCKDGSERQVLIQVSWVGDKRLVNFTDITDQWNSEQRNRAHNAMLEMVAKAESLSNILHTLAQSVEEESPSSLCSVHILDDTRKHLLTVAAPNLPEFYNEATDKVEIGDGVGSCGTAVFRRERVIVEDISTHEYWQDFADLAKQAGLAACWSEPIISSDGRVLGTFAIYHRQPATPNLEEIERIAFAANLAAIAIENRQTRDELIQRELLFRTLTENAPINIGRYDLQKRMIYANPKLLSTYPVPLEPLLGKDPSEVADLPNMEILLNAISHTMDSGEESSIEIEIPTLDGELSTHLVTMVAERDESGTIIGALATGQDITERIQLEKQLKEREREFRSLAENAPVNIARYDLEGNLIYANPELVSTIIMPMEGHLDKSMEDQPTLLPFSATFLNAVKHTLQSGDETSFEIKVPTKDGDEETHYFTMVTEHGESGAVTGILCTGLDITERKLLEERLSEREREFRTLAENIPINISRFDRDGYLTYANSRLAGDFPLTIDKLFGTQLSDEPTQPYTEIVNNSIVRTLEDGVERSFEIEIPVTGGGFVTHLITMVGERDESGSIIGVLATGQNVSERKRLQRELERQARLDFLTGLLNRRYFMELAKMELLRLKRYSGKLSLIMFDIDHFKQINDSYGHNTGDLVLKRIAQLSHDTVRETDIVGRIGGEEFVVLLPQTDKNQAYEIAERLRHIIDTEKVEPGDETVVQFTASFGIATIDSEATAYEKSTTIDDLLNIADKAMYRAKQSGRNKVCQDQ